MKIFVVVGAFDSSAMLYQTLSRASRDASGADVYVLLRARDFTLCNVGFVVTTRDICRQVAAHCTSVARWEFVPDETGGFPHVNAIVELASRTTRPLKATTTTARNSRAKRASNTRRDNLYASQLAHADERLYCVCHKVDGGRDMSQCTNSNC